MARIAGENHCSVTHAIQHGAGQRFLDSYFDAVERRSGAAESEHAGGTSRIVAHERCGYRDRLCLGKPEFMAVFIPSQIRIVKPRQECGDERRNRRWRHDIDLCARMAPDRQPLEIADEVGGDFFNARHSIRQARSLSGAVIERLARPEHWDFALKVVD